MINNEKLISYLKDRGVLKTQSIIDSITLVDRKDFVLKGSYLYAYSNVPLDIGFNQTISKPYTVAFMLELLGIQKGDKILDVGSGSGWTTTLIANLVGENGKVLGLELINELVDFGTKNLSKYNFTWAEIISSNENFDFIFDSYDKILVSASPSGGIPKQLLKRLKVNGIMVIPIDDSIYKVTKLSDDKIDIEKFNGFSFVPLICS